MGLDMYLYARRSFEPTSATADQILAAAGMSLAELQTQCLPNEQGYVDDVYLPRWDHTPADQREMANAVVDAAGLTTLTTEDARGASLGFKDGIIEVAMTCAYWRKANAIHHWFVQECQAGVDECQVSDPIPYEKLAHLASLCGDAIAAYEAGDFDKAESIITPTSGFFFGGTDIDEWYVRDLRDTAAQLERCVRLAIASTVEMPVPVEFQYHSSW